jgi:hypothetical protein
VIASRIDLPTAVGQLHLATAAAVDVAQLRVIWRNPSRR